MALVGNQALSNHHPAHDQVVTILAACPNQFDVKPVVQNQQSGIKSHVSCHDEWWGVVLAALARQQLSRPLTCRLQSSIYCHACLRAAWGCCGRQRLKRIWSMHSPTAQPVRSRTSGSASTSWSLSASWPAAWHPKRICSLTACKSTFHLSRSAAPRIRSCCARLPHHQQNRFHCGSDIGHCLQSFGLPPHYEIRNDCQSISRVQAKVLQNLRVRHPSGSGASMITSVSGTSTADCVCCII